MTRFRGPNCREDLHQTTLIRTCLKIHHRWHSHNSIVQAGGRDMLGGRSIRRAMEVVVRNMVEKNLDR